AVVFRRIDEREERQVGQKQRPVSVEAPQEPLPVDRLGAVTDDVHDVRTVEALTLHHKTFLPEKLLNWRDLDRHAEDVGVERVREPIVVYAADPVARAEDEVYVIA